MEITIEKTRNGYILVIHNNVAMFGIQKLVFTDFEDMLTEIRRLMEVKK